MHSFPRSNLAVEYDIPQSISKDCMRSLGKQQQVARKANQVITVYYLPNELLVNCYMNVSYIDVISVMFATVKKTCKQQ